MTEIDLNLLYASAQASVHFAVKCLEPIGKNLRLRSSFVTPDGTPVHWHEFGDLEGPGWAANTVGGAHLLYRWGLFLNDPSLQSDALRLLDHILEDGFIDSQTGLIYPYYDLGKNKFCLNYSHADDWLCPGSLARIGTQLLEFSDDLAGDPRAGRMRNAASSLGSWLTQRVTALPNGWLPRRITLEGKVYPYSPSGGMDAIHESSADGLYLVQLWSELDRRGLGTFQAQAVSAGQAFVEAGGLFGSINHDTYDHHESVAYACAFRILRQAGGYLSQPEWQDFAYRVALPGLDYFRMDDDRHGVLTTGLYWMEKSWNTAYLWENAEAALAYMEAWVENHSPTHLKNGLGILQAIATHHHGDAGFLTEGVDWDNHVSSRHHIENHLFGDIRYTEPLLNNLHLLAPTLFYFQQTGYQAPKEMDSQRSIELVSDHAKKTYQPPAGADGVRYLLRFYYPALETDVRLLQALDFTRRSQADGVLLFEASYDMDAALLTLEVLTARFARLKAIVPRFRELVPEVHINVMITLGHVDAGSGRPERFPFQFMVDEFGNSSRSTACPLDPAFLNQAAALYRLAAECKPDAVWVDDDTRYVVHDTSGMTCFCGHHLATMQARTGRTWTRQELVEALKDDSLKPGLRQIWFDVQEESILQLAGTIERTVHSVNPEIAVGLMSVGQSLHAAEGRRSDRLLRTLAGKKQPLIRPGSGFWNDERPLGAFDKAEGCARELSFMGEDRRAAAEVENHPYTPYGKSDCLLALELTLNVLNGMPNLSLNLLTSMAGNGPVEPEGTDYAGFLTQWRPFLDAVAKEAAGKRRLGIGVADHEDAARHARLRGTSLMGWVQSRPWESLLARLGFPLGRPDGSPHWLSGDVIRAISDYELAWYLREGAVLDPLAAQGLIERGWGKRLGLEKVTKIGDAVNEILVDDPINGQRNGQNPACLQPHPLRSVVHL